MNIEDAIRILEQDRPDPEDMETGVPDGSETVQPYCPFCDVLMDRIGTDVRRPEVEVREFECPDCGGRIRVMIDKRGGVR